MELYVFGIARRPCTHRSCIHARAQIPGLSVAVAQRGIVAWSEGYGSAARDTAFMFASVSKTLTATAFMLLHDRGWPSLD